ncbi:MAG: hypothetical protein AAF203_06795 [Pseudomonadota bacterium]
MPIPHRSPAPILMKAMENGRLFEDSRGVRHYQGVLACYSIFSESGGLISEEFCTVNEMDSSVLDTQSFVNMRIEGTDVGVILNSMAVARVELQTVLSPKTASGYFTQAKYVEVECFKRDRIDPLERFQQPYCLMRAHR